MHYESEQEIVEVSQSSEEEKYQDQEVSSKETIEIKELVQEEKEVKKRAEYKFKEIEKLIDHPQTYKIFNSVPFYTSISRPQGTLENYLEQQLVLRMKKFVPTNFDLTDYDRELFKK